MTASLARATPEIKQGEIYWVDIPQSQTVGSEQYNRRPYLIVSRTSVNRVCETVVGVPLSTAVDLTKPMKHPFRVLIPAHEIIKDVLYNGEVKVCVAKADQTRVLSKARLEKRMGVLSSTAIAAVSVGLAFLFDIR